MDPLKKFMTPPKNTASWQGRPILDPEHAHDLEQRAAIAELYDKLPTPRAEEKAYDGYIRDKRLEACAHHLNGMKAAQAVGDTESSQKHGALYKLHMDALGLDPMNAPPSEVTAKLKGEEPPRVYRFKAHKGDFFAVPNDQGEDLGKSEREYREGDRVEMRHPQRGHRMRGQIAKLFTHEATGRPSAAVDTDEGQLKVFTDALTPMHKAELADPVADLRGSDRSIFTRLEKTSRNVKEQRAKATPEQAEGRRAQYASSIGLKPQASAGRRGVADRAEPVASRIPFYSDRSGGNDLVHETAHAMMAPKNKTIRSYFRHLTNAVELPDDVRESLDYNGEAVDHPAYHSYADAVHDESIARRLEYKIDRRAGVDPHQYTGFRDLAFPTGDPREGETYVYGDGNPGDREAEAAYNEELGRQGEEAAYHARRFDQGARFDRYGRIADRPTLDATINARAQLPKSNIFSRIGRIRPTVKSEMAKAERRVCRCDRYSFPHRHGSGKCSKDVPALVK